MKIFIFLYYVVYLFTEISARLASDALKIAQIIELVNSMYSDEALSDAGSNKHGRVSPKREPEIVLHTSPKHNTIEKPHEDAQESPTDKPLQRRAPPENVRLTVNELLSLNPILEENNHLQPQRFIKVKKKYKKKEKRREVTKSKKASTEDKEIADIKPDMIEGKTVDFESIDAKNRITQKKKQANKKGIRLIIKKKRQRKDSGRSKGKGKKKENTIVHSDKDNSKPKENLDKKKRIKKKDKPLRLTSTKINRESEELNSRYLFNEQNEEIVEENTINYNQVMKIENDENVWKNMARQGLVNKMDKMEKEWNKRHLHYAKYEKYDPRPKTEYENDIGIIDNVSDMDMDDEWQSRHFVTGTEDSKILNSFERN